MIKIATTVRRGRGFSSSHTVVYGISTKEVALVIPDSIVSKR